MSEDRVCPHQLSRVLDSNIRKIIHNPKKILKPYISKDMKVLDVGCGPGFFTKEMAKLVGNSGSVTAADLQEEMLLFLKDKIKNTNLEGNINFHKTEKDELGLSDDFDFILVFFMLHEVPNQRKFLKELYNHLNRDGKILISEPKFHVTKKDFQESLNIINDIGFKIIERPSIFFGRSVLIQKE
ncbi:MAG: class I SAM-dependent methyltransferase [Methanobacteriaceae archaeon]|jgi:ubiquinone/menaquinone biosynthesis C-methylase UbiE|nr:class I SAM-dependent methyltransferase [Candidatus Methanorudis spinitermitis]